jgi:hypothetical protein
MAEEAPRGAYEPPDSPAADKHAAYVIDLVEFLDAGDKQGAARLLARMHEDPTLEPWTLVLGAATIAARRRPCTRPHRT